MMDTSIPDVVRPRADPYWVELEQTGKMHVSWAHYMEPFDFAPCSCPERKQVMIASTPRSGSTALCLALWRTGVLGAPLEYLNFHLTTNVARWKFDEATATSYWHELHELRTSPNGVFSYKLFATQYAELLQKSPQIVPLIAPDHVVFLSRRDKLGQAISLSKASRSGVWFAGSRPRNSPPPLDIDHVKKMYLALTHQEMHWEHIFDMTQAVVHRVFYEDFCTDAASVVAGIVKHVEVDGDTPCEVSIPAIGIQRNETSATWATRLKDLENAWRAEAVAAWAT